jgi:hypothetical protein
MKVPSSILKRLEGLEQARGTEKTIGLWPPLMSLDEWEKIAMASQEKLCADARDCMPVRIHNS